MQLSTDRLDIILHPKDKDEETMLSLLDLFVMQ
jgi:hypothetical protein